MQNLASTRRRLLRSGLISWALAGSLALSGCASGPTAYSGDAGWVATWGASPAIGDATTAFNNQTVRVVVHTTLGGEQVRVRVSNAFSTQPLEVGGAQVGVHAGGAAVVPGTHRKLSFGGSPTVMVPPGAVVVSDPVALTVANGADLAVSLYLPKNTAPVTQHTLASQTSFTAPGDSSAVDGAAPFATKIATWPYVSGVEVQAGRGSRAVVVFGDSISDGFKSTADANARWPDHLARRLQAAGKKTAVVNQGISGNRMFWDAHPAVPHFGVSGLARFDRDVLTVTGASHVVLLLSINDIGQPGMRKLTEQEVTAQQIIVGMRQVIARAHARGLKVIAGTLTPFDTYTGVGYYTPQGEAKRQAVNAWIRSGREFDGVIDFDAVMRDPANPSKFLPAYDSGDHLHPNDAGYKAMGDAVDLALFD